MNITQFSIEEVRCFAERQDFEIRPLTFLVGENSTGKTTALACFQVLADYLTKAEEDFNCDPYSMGIFRDIVRNSRKKNRAFKLGFTSRLEKENDVEFAESVVEFVEKKGEFQPAVSSVTLKFIDGEIVFRPNSDVKIDFNSDDMVEPHMYMRLVSFDKKHNQFHIGFNADIHHSMLFYFPRLTSDNQSEGGRALQRYLDNKLVAEWWPISLSAFSISPLRSRPKRTYDPKRVFDDPEGSDMPMYLMQMQATQPERWEALKEELREFGRRSGLFEDVQIKNLKWPGAPFQLRIKVRGPNASIIDVGYGVSQVLPILMQILDPPWSHGHETEIPFFLLQQPEIHLHPKAQAELSSFLATFAGQGTRSFLVETHSDYMIDRARIEIRKGTIRPEDVSLIYLEPKGRTVKVHNISFDKIANMIGVPKHYGEFFLKETDRLMGFEN